MSVATAGVPQAAPSVKRQAPALGERGARRRPTPGGTRRAAGPASTWPSSVDPAAGVVVGDPRLQLVAQRARRRRSARAGRGRVARACSTASSSSSKRFTGASRPTAITVGSGQRSPPGEKNGSTPLSTAVTSSGRKPSAQQLLAGRLRRRHRRGPSVERRRHPRLEEPPGAGERRRQDLVPHRAVDVVEDRHVRGRRYQTGENHGTPFQISTSASERPIRPVSSDTAVRGNTE